MPELLVILALALLVLGPKRRCDLELGLGARRQRDRRRESTPNSVNSAFGRWGHHLGFKNAPTRHASSTKPTLRVIMAWARAESGWVSTQNLFRV